MPLFMDIHDLGEIDGESAAGAHARDLEVQAKYGANYLRYWVSEEQGKVFCLVEAPSAQAAVDVHKEAHGLVADDVVPVIEGA